MPRTEADILHDQHSDDPVGSAVEMGGRVYFIKPIKGRVNTRAIREKIGPMLNEILDLMKKVETQGENLSLEKVEDLAPFITLLGPRFDEMLDVVYDYSPEIMEDKERLEQEAMEEEFARALIVVVGMLIGPFVRGLNSPES